MSYVFLAGASRGVGREIASLLRSQGRSVAALVRSPSDRENLSALGIEAIAGDALNVDEVKHAMHAKPVSAVISTIGGLPKDGQRADYLGNKNLIDVAANIGVRKFVLISSIGAGDSVVALPPSALEVLGEVLKEKEKAEQHLIHSGLTYTILRPGGLLSEPATGNGMLTDDATVSGSITRPDVAQLACLCLDAEGADNKVLSAVDRMMMRSEKAFREFLL